jgi:hypothetical protein
LQRLDGLVGLGNGEVDACVVDTSEEILKSFDGEGAGLGSDEDLVGENFLGAPEGGLLEQLEDLLDDHED